jgi:O-acetylhomoserine/O-acetylserine sulfhydrylase-like pyridoxal-dependent enzyme
MIKKPEEIAKDDRLCFNCRHWLQYSEHSNQFGNCLLLNHDYHPLYLKETPAHFGCVNFEFEGDGEHRDLLAENKILEDRLAQVSDTWATVLIKYNRILAACERLGFIDQVNETIKMIEESHQKEYL